MDTVQTHTHNHFNGNYSGLPGDGIVVEHSWDRSRDQSINQPKEIKAT